MIAKLFVLGAVVMAGCFLAPSGAVPKLADLHRGGSVNLLADQIGGFHISADRGQNLRPNGSIEIGAMYSPVGNAAALRSNVQFGVYRNSVSPHN
ncbi:MAG: hypothetical protein JWR07_3736 [Nevskia sp.]|nr:hypothetical protein [Nevskia sp.]